MASHQRVEGVPPGGSMKRSLARAGLAVKLTAVLLVAGCGGENAYVEPPPPEVIVAKPVQQPVLSYLEYTGTTRAVETVDVRARVKGFLKEKLFQEGTAVKEGQLLMVIDEEPFEAQLELAKAQLAEAEAALTTAEQSKSREIAEAQEALDEAQLLLARVGESRQRNLRARNAASQEDVDQAEANRKKFEAQVAADRASREQARADYETKILAAKASVESAKASVRSAQIDLSYCRMYAPIDGEISRNLVDVGNFVGDGQTTLLATIVKTDPIYAYISVSEADVLRFKELVRQGKREDYRTTDMPIELGLSNETGFPHEGRVQYADPGVDPGTGTVRARGIFPNPKGIIDPGMFVRVRVPFEHRDNALLVPERALGADQGGRYLLVLDKENVVERRSVTVGTEVGDLRVVDGKIGLNDRVVIDGLQRARPGLKVRPRAAADGKAASEPAVAESKSAPNRAS